MTFRVDYTEPAEIEARDIFLQMMRDDPERADRWRIGLEAATASLAEFPRRFPRIPDPERYQGDVRRVLYGNYHLIYRIHDAAEDDAEGIVRILHIFHAARDADK